MGNDNRYPKEISLQNVSHGYDGNPPKIRKIRDRDGAGRREIIAAYRDSALSTLAFRGSIDSLQREAGERLQNDEEALRKSGGSMLGLPGGNQYSGGASLVAVEAARRAKKAWGCIPSRCQGALYLLLVENKGLKEIAAAFGVDRNKISERVCVALDELTIHYGLRTDRGLAGRQHK